MRCNYSLMPADIIGQEHTLLPKLKAAGVDQIWVVDCLTGRHVASPEQTAQAKRILDRHGFDSRGFISVVVGHPGNALNPEDPTLELAIPSEWRYRIDRHGNPVYFCADIEPRMMADNVAAARQMKELGFEQFFADDDLRLGNWGPEIQGCFCSACLADFSQHLGATVSRAELSRAIERLDDSALLEEWVGFNCHKIETLAAALAAECHQFGIMVMHHGDERHGLDLAEWRRVDANMLIRVGEMYFSDESYNLPSSKVSELVSILQHLTCVGRANSYSETTIFPPRALTPENWVHKMRLTLLAGTENLFFMGGTWIIEDPYWQAETAALSGLRKLAALSAPQHHYPIHLISGTHGALGEAIDPPPLPFLAGLPVLPVRGAHIPDGGQILLAFGKYKITKEWDEALAHYQLIVCDEDLIEANPSLLQRQPFVLPLRIRENNPGSLEVLRHALEQNSPQFPYLAEGRDVCISWVDGGLLLLNMLPQQNAGTLAYLNSRRPFSLAPLSAAYAPLAGQAIGDVQPVI